jgi:hypothetical protein
MCVCALRILVEPGRAGPCGPVQYDPGSRSASVGRAGTTLLVGMGGPVQDRPVHEQSVPGQLSPALKAAVVLSEYFTRFYHLELLSFHLRIKYTKT